jgi:anti-sigma regulatory factor (Ser/Thr protein kinase)
MSRAEREDARTLVVPGSREGVRQALDGLRAFWEAAGLSADAAWPFEVALDEVLSNIVLHGLGGGRGEAAVEVRLRRSGDAVEIEVVDEAGPFDPLAAPAAPLAGALEDRPVGGLGIALVRQVMDAVSYERREGRNRLSLRRRVGA